MTAVAFDFTLPGELEAREPSEARGVARDRVRMLVGRREAGTVEHRRFDALPEILAAGDVLVVNTSGTLPAALDVIDSDHVVHFSTELPGGEWVVELRRGLEPSGRGAAGEELPVVGGATVTLLRPYTRGRLWVARFSVPGVPDYLMAHGRPIRYSYVDHDWPISAYHSVFATTPGSAEMPSASRPFTESLVTRLVNRGIVFAPILLHTGVASPEAHEKPYPERYSVSSSTARLVNSARAAGGRIIAVGTTAVRALESATDERGVVGAVGGWTSLVVTPSSGVRATDGLITGFHEPRASHLDMLTAIAGPSLLDLCYQEALATGYLWHEFGDTNLLLP
ncbi:MAG TPA: S-adenosylmethionine:tRNA ribosyltransferase-isomerase [Micromonosporaceae bacterium]|jgi:S-adenosylmethionine:tRNA ribosyltransferase-isomerase